MQLPDSNDNWQIIIDFPEPLQFVGYIGQQERFKLRCGRDDEPSSINEWHWWDWRFWSLSDTRWFNPPDFTALRLEPTKKALCLKHWPAFEQKWPQLQIELIEKQFAQFSRLNIQNLIKARQKETQRDINDFEFKINFVWWPDYYGEVEIGKQLQFLLSTYYLEEVALSNLGDLLKHWIEFWFR
jgi:hypothetical protein